MNHAFPLREAGLLVVITLSFFLWLCLLEYKHYDDARLFLRFYCSHFLYIPNRLSYLYLGACCRGKELHVCLREGIEKIHAHLYLPVLVSYHICYALSDRVRPTDTAFFRHLTVGFESDCRAR